MEEILIQLEVPALKVRYDVFVPVDLEISGLMDILIGGVEDLSNGKYFRSGHEQLSLKDPALLLDPSRTLKEYSVPDGAGMMLL